MVESSEQTVVHWESLTLWPPVAGSSHEFLARSAKTEEKQDHLLAFKTNEASCLL
jgi:hypothetical protein